VDRTASLGEGCVLYPGAYVGPRARLGRECILYPNAVVYDDCVLGDRVILHAGAIIGADGYGYASRRDDDKVVRHHKIPQMGNVVLEDDVEVGANTTIDRAAIGSTVIGRGTKIDNLVTVGHGASVGEHGLLVAQSGIAGSTVVGHHVTMAGQAGVAGHLKIGDNVTIGAGSIVTQNLPSNVLAFGQPCRVRQEL
jgi:UDP-3-O-[3-hydroxymyristoyl] glucosamine N-acyltransferase